MQPPHFSASDDERADFLLEASPHDQATFTEGLLAVSALLPPDSSRLRGAERLALAVSDLPLRYAPFFGRLATLWQISEDEVRHELTRAKHPQAWSATWLRGIKTFDIRANPTATTRSRLMCFTAGVRFPKHRHRAAERVLVLEGSYVDSTGREVTAGEDQLMPAGSEHQLHIPGTRDCIAAVSESGLEFTGPVLKWVTKLLG